MDTVHSYGADCGNRGKAMIPLPDRDTILVKALELIRKLKKIEVPDESIP